MEERREETRGGMREERGEETRGDETGEATWHELGCHGGALGGRDTAEPCASGGVAGIHKRAQ